MTGETNLSGLWTGWYGYAGDDDRVAFTAWIDDRGGLIEGSTLEPNTFSAAHLEELEAELSGLREAGAVDLIKRYRPGQGAHGLTIAYFGQIEGDGCVLAGGWSFVEADLGEGDFRLERQWQRPARASEKAAAIAQPVSGAGVSEAGEAR